MLVCAYVKNLLSFGHSFLWSSVVIACRWGAWSIDRSMDHNAFGVLTKEAKQEKQQ